MTWVTRLRRAVVRRRCAACTARVLARETYCGRCGQELIERTRDEVQLNKL